MVDNGDFASAAAHHIRHHPFMPRGPRLRLPGVPLHIVQRGNNRAACFFGDSDFAFYLNQLRVLAVRFECSIHAYVLMTNHVHLLLTPTAPDGVSLLMKHLSQRYVQYVNKIHSRTGTLWEGRYKSCLTQSEFYVLACYRYIELNPVRARMVDHPRQYHWSSHASNAGGSASPILTPHPEYLRLGRTDADRRAAYLALFRGMGDGAAEAESARRIREATSGSAALGDSSFRTQVAVALGLRTRPGQPGRPRRPGLSPIGETRSD